MNNIKRPKEIFDIYAKNYESKFMDLSLYHDTFDLFCETIGKEDAKILELACGPGNITQYLLKQRPKYKILGTDLSLNMLELAQKNNPTAEFETMDCRDLGKLTTQYDALLFGFGLPYISREEAIQLIANASKILTSKGVIYLSTMEDEYSKSGLKPTSDGKFKTYMHYHEAGYLIDALKENGFEIVSVDRKDYPENNGTVTVDLVIIGKLVSENN